MDDIANTSGQSQASLTSGTSPAGAQNAGSQPKGVGGGEISGIIGTVANLIEGGYGEREAARRANQYAQDQMILSNQLTTDLQNKAAAHQLNYFNETARYNSPEEQVKRLKQAGLNPALAYGSAAGAGGSGQTGSAPGGQTSAVGSQKANVAGAKAANTDAAIGMASLMADIKLKESQARKNTVEADYTEGVKTEETVASVQLMVDQLKTAGLGREGMKIQQAKDRIDYELSESTLGTRKQQIFEDYEQMVAKTGIMYEELATARRNNKIGDETEKIIIEQAKANLHDTWTNIVLKRAQEEATRMGTSLTEQQTENLKTQGVMLLKENDYWRTIHVVHPGMRLEIMRDAEQRAQAERMDRALMGMINGILSAGAVKGTGGAAAGKSASAGAQPGTTRGSIRPDYEYWEKGLGK